MSDAKKEIVERIVEREVIRCVHVLDPLFLLICCFFISDCFIHLFRLHLTHFFCSTYRSLPSPPCLSPTLSLSLCLSLSLSLSHSHPLSPTLSLSFSLSLPLSLFLSLSNSLSISLSLSLCLSLYLSLI